MGVTLRMEEDERREGSREEDLVSILCKESQTCRGCLRAHSRRTHTRQTVWVPRTRVTRPTLVCDLGVQGGCSHTHRLGGEGSAVPGQTRSHIHWGDPSPSWEGSHSLLRGQPGRPDPRQRTLLNLGLGGSSPWACKL